MKYKKLNIVILILTFVGVLGFVIYKDGWDNLVRMFGMIHPGFLCCAVLFMILYWILEGGILHCVIRAFHSRQKFWYSFRTSMIGQLFNCVTPFASGGQPVQAYDLVKCGVPLGVASSSLIVKFMIYQVALTVYSAVVLLFYWRSFAGMVNGFGWLVFVGFTINFLVMLALCAVCVFRKFTYRLVTGLVNLLAKVRLVKDKQKTLEYIDGELDQFHDSFNAMKLHKGRMAASFVLSLVQLTVFFLIPYFILLAFGIRKVSPLIVISAEAFVVMISSFVPLPGAAGGAEFSFYTFFEPLFPVGISVNLAMLLWRLITFYFPILAGMLFMMSSSKSKPESAVSKAAAEADSPI